MVVAAPVAGCRDGSDPAPSAVTSPVTLPAELVPSTTSAAAPDVTPSTVTGSPSTGGPPTVEAFTVRAPLTCEGPSFGATVEWRATGATSATILVDRAQVAGPVPVSGPFDLVLGCDGTVHTVVLVLAAPDGSTVLQTRAVLASAGR